MTRHTIFRTAPLVLLLATGLPACSSDDTSTSEAKDPVDPNDPNDVKEPPADDWQLLLDADWSLPPGEEGYFCARSTIEEDTYVRAFRPIAPLGTHHTLLTLETSTAASTEQDGVFKCNAATIGSVGVFGSGVGTEPFEMPDGVAIKLEAGSRVILNLHLFNTSLDELTGRSGIEFIRTDPVSVDNEAEIILAGKVLGLTVPPGESTQTGECAMSHDVTIFAVAPHMHQLGVHLKSTALPEGAEPRVLYDQAYSFEEQRYLKLEPDLHLKAGDRVSVECGYENDTGQTVTFGDSSLAEMCFTGLYRYPKGKDPFICTAEGSSAEQPSIPGPPCAQEGATGNDLGVGRQCEKNGGECTSPMICLADFVLGDFGNFCTTLCKSDDECGEGARCAGRSGQTICIPDSCELPTPDGGAP